MAKQLGLEMYRDKCELVGHSDDPRSLFASTYLKPCFSLITMGAPLSAGPHLDAVLES